MVRKKHALILLVVSVIVLIGVAASVGLFPGVQTNGRPDNDSQPPAVEENVCGDDVCSGQETCLSCGQDCKCGSNKYCNQQGECVTPQCGNGNCEPYESLENCCEDCGPCPSPGEICNETTHRCEMPTADIGDAQVIKLAEEHCRDNNWTVESSEVVSSVVIEGERAKAARVKVKEDKRPKLIAVTESKRVVEYQFP